MAMKLDGAGDASNTPMAEAGARAGVGAGAWEIGREITVGTGDGHKDLRQMKRSNSTKHVGLLLGIRGPTRQRKGYW